MRVKSLRFLVDRAFLYGIVALSRLRLSAFFEMVDGRWAEHDMVLWSLEEFLGYDRHRRPTLDKATLLAVSQRFKQDRQFRRDCLSLRLRPVPEQHALSRTDFRWPVGASARRALFSQLPWETDFARSPHASSVDHTWVDASFLISLINFPLMSHAVYAHISFCIQQQRQEQQQSRQERRSSEETTRFANAMNGAGMCCVKTPAKSIPMPPMSSMRSTTRRAVAPEATPRVNICARVVTSAAGGDTRTAAVSGTRHSAIGAKRSRAAEIALVVDTTLKIGERDAPAASDNNTVVQSPKKRIRMVAADAHF